MDLGDLRVRCHNRKKNFYEQKSQTLHPDAFIVPLAKYETKLVLQSEMEGVEAIGFP